MADADYSRIAAAMVPAQAMQYPYPSLVDALAATHPPEEPGWLEQQRRKIAPYVEPFVSWQNKAMENAPESFQRLANAFSESPRLNPLVDAHLSVGEGIEHLNDLQRRWEAERQLGLPQQAPPAQGFGGRVWDMMSGNSDVSMPLVGMLGGGGRGGGGKFDPEYMLERYGTLTPWSGFRPEGYGAAAEPANALAAQNRASPFTLEAGTRQMAIEEAINLQKEISALETQQSGFAKRSPQWHQIDRRLKEISRHPLYKAAIGSDIEDLQRAESNALNDWGNARAWELRGERNGGNGNSLNAMIPGMGPSGLGPEAEAATAAKLGGKTGYKLEREENGYNGGPLNYGTFKIHGNPGDLPGRLEGKVLPDDPKTFYIDWIRGPQNPANYKVNSHTDVSNTLGPSAIRDLLGQLRDHYPEIERISGDRTTGAKRGSYVDIGLPPKK